MLLHALSVQMHLQHQLCQRSNECIYGHALFYSYNASWCCVHASNLLHIGCAIGQLEQMALLTLLCLQADRKWGDMPVRGSMDSDASSGCSTPREAVHRRSSLFSTSTNSRPGGSIRSDRQPGGGARDDIKKAKRKSAEIARDGNDPVTSQHKSAETAQDGNMPPNGQRKSAETARPGQEISSLAHRSRSVGDAIAAFAVGRSRSSTLRAPQGNSVGSCP